MKKTLSLLALLFAGAALSQTVDIRFRGTIDTVRGTFVATDLPDGGSVFEVQCHAEEADLADGGTWKLNVTSAGPVVRDMPNAAVRVCKRDLLRANRMDGGL